jgi:DNA transposition AAA+ family ATPase
MGISPTALSQFLSRQYQGDNDGMAEKITKYLSAAEARLTAPELPPFVMTEAAKEVFFSAGYAQGNAGISLVYGRAGVGKTLAITEFIKQNVGVVYVAMREGDNIKDSCARILSALGKKPKGTRAALMDMILDILGNTNRLLIIDEAQHLSSRAINNLRTLNDIGKIPILFAGSPEVYETIQDERYLDQISSRICPKREIKDKPSINDIQLIFEPYNLNRKCIEALYTIACNPGVLRNMVMVYKMAVAFAAASGEPFNEKYLTKGQKQADSKRR